MIGRLTHRVENGEGEVRLSVVLMHARPSLVAAQIMQSTYLLTVTTKVRRHGISLS